MPISTGAKPAGQDERAKASGRLNRTLTPVVRFTDRYRDRAIWLPRLDGNDKSDSDLGKTGRKTVDNQSSANMQKPGG